MKKNRTFVLVILSLIAGMAYLTPLIRFSFYDQMKEAMGLTDVRLEVLAPYTGFLMSPAMFPAEYWRKNSIRRNC